MPYSEIPEIEGKDGFDPDLGDNTETSTNVAPNYANSESIGSINVQVNSEQISGYDPVFVGTGGVANLYAWNVRVPNIGSPVPEIEGRGAFTIGATIDDILVSQGSDFTSLLTGKSYSRDDMNHVPMAMLGVPAPGLGDSEAITQVILHTNMDYDDDDPYMYINIKGGVDSSGFSKYKVYLTSTLKTYSKLATRVSFHGNTLYQLERLRERLSEVERKMDSILGDVTNRFVAR